jgi:hypothetical protein
MTKKDQSDLHRVVCVFGCVLFYMYFTHDFVRKFTSISYLQPQRWINHARLNLFNDIVFFGDEPLEVSTSDMPAGSTPTTLTSTNLHKITTLSDTS